MYVGSDCLSPGPLIRTEELLLGLLGCCCHVRGLLVTLHFQEFPVWVLNHLLLLLGLTEGPLFQVGTAAGIGDRGHQHLEGWLRRRKSTHAGLELRTGSEVGL